MMITECDRCLCTHRESEGDTYFKLSVTSAAQDEDGDWDLCPDCYNEWASHFMTEIRLNKEK